MKNSLPLLLLPMLLISIGMYLYTSQSTKSDSLGSNTALTPEMSTQELEAFNSQFTIYGGEQTGAKLKLLIGTVIENANTYMEDPSKMPEVTAEIMNTDMIDSERPEITVIEAKSPEESNEEQIQKYINALDEIRNKLENKHTYNVSFGYSSKGILNNISIGF